MNLKNLLNKTFEKKKILITGHTGFKGSWLSLWLKELGSEVYGISKDIPTKPSNYLANNLDKEVKNYNLNITDFKKTYKIIEKLQPDYIFHLAAQSLVKKSYKDPIETWNTNLIGTINLLESLKSINKKCFCIIITSDKCYDNIEWEWGYRENDKLGGPDPYSASKGSAEIAFSSYARSFYNQNQRKIFLSSARAGNVIGGGDWAEDRIVPDCIKSWSKSKIVKIRNPKATRPWQHVLEPLSGYLKLAAYLSKNEEISGRSYNFGPSAENNYTVKDLVNKMSKYWDKVSWLDSSASNKGPYESNLLKLNCDRALKELSWTPTLNINTTVRFTVEWYKKFYESQKDIPEFTRDQINEFMQINESKNIEK